LGFGLAQPLSDEEVVDAVLTSIHHHMQKARKKYCGV
jgi:hypothetical protein